MRLSKVSLLHRLLLVAALTAVAAACGDTPKFCEQCGRGECRNLSFDVRLESGSLVQTCCPRCALHYLAERHPAVASLAVQDFDGAGRIDATRAIYVEGSDVSPCAATEGPPPRDERGCCMKTVYDRCLPSLVAFASRPRAETFARSHGGVLKTFAELQAKTR